MRRHITNTLNSVNLVNGVNQTAEIRTIMKIKSIGIDILTKKIDFFIPLSGKFLNLTTNIINLTACFPAADIRHNTISTELIASLHNRYPSKNPAFSHRMKFTVIIHAVRIHLRRHDHMRTFCPPAGNNIL